MVDDFVEDVVVVVEVVVAAVVFGGGGSASFLYCPFHISASEDIKIFNFRFQMIRSILWMFLRLNEILKITNNFEQLFYYKILGG